jgi:hypothetical protein
MDQCRDSCKNGIQRSKGDVESRSLRCVLRGIFARQEGRNEQGVHPEYIVEKPGRSHKGGRKVDGDERDEQGKPQTRRG